MYRERDRARARRDGGAERGATLVEFALVLPDCTIDRAMEIVERLELVCQGVTFSTGVARWDGIEDVQSLVRRADDALYLAKSQGGGRSVLAEGKVA